MQPPTPHNHQVAPLPSSKRVAIAGANYLAYLLAGLTLGLVLDLVLFIEVLIHLPISSRFASHDNVPLQTALNCIGAMLPISAAFGFGIQAKRWPLHAICSGFCIVLSIIAIPLLVCGVIFVRSYFFDSIY